jgi:nitroreductase
MELDKAIKERHSVRKFSTKLPDWRDILKCIDATRNTPMAGNNFTVRFIVVSNPERILKISQACEQPFVATAKYVVIVCSVPGKISTTYGKQGETYIRQQAGAAIENFLLKLVDLKLSACWVGYFMERNIKELMKIPDDVQVEAVIPVGYEYEKGKRKTKIELDTILYFDKYGNREMRKKESIEV